MTCACPTTAAHAGGCPRPAERKDSVVGFRRYGPPLCSFCSDGHTSREDVLKFRVSKDTPVALVVEAPDAAAALEIAEPMWTKIWDRLDLVATELEKELGVEVVIGFAYDDVDVTEEDDPPASPAPDVTTEGTGG